MKFIWIFLLWPLVGEAQVLTPDLSFLCRDLLQAEPKIRAELHFTREFREAVSTETLVSIFRSLSAEAGNCVEMRVDEIEANRYRVHLEGSKRLRVSLRAVQDPVQKLLSGLRLEGIEDPAVRISSGKDLARVLSGMDDSGTLAASLMTEKGAMNLQINGDTPLAVGSTFKLYVLGTLSESIRSGHHRWEEELALREEWKSLPSGIMQDWPAGRAAPLLTYATNMIENSDNTATDHLIHLLGRKRVERMVQLMGNRHLGLFTPFPTTMELFKLKWAVSPEESLRYLTMNRNDRNRTLEALSSVPADRIFTNGVDPRSPTLIDRLEWFASTRENCKAMFWLDRRKDPQIRKILSKQIPALDGVGTDSSHWRYAGYKGGSEPGVLNLTYVLESKLGNRACLSLTWNNTLRPVSLTRLLDVAKKTLKFAETRIP